MTTTLSVADRRRATLERREGEPQRPSGRGQRSATRDSKRPDSKRASARRSRARRNDRPRLAPRRTLDGQPPRSTGLVRSAITRSIRQSVVGRPDRQRTLGPPPGTFYVIAAVVAVFVVLGLVMVLSASAVTQANVGNSPYAVFTKQAIWAGLGLIGMVAATKLPYTIWRPITIPLGLFGLAAMVGPFVPGVGVTINGARSWVRIGGFSVQPSEFLKLILIVVAADMLARREREMADYRRTLLPFAFVVTLAAALCLVQGDLGSAIVIGAIGLSIAWIAGVPLMPLTTFSMMAVVTAIGFVMSSPRRLNRFTAFLDIEGHKDHESYQVFQGMLSIANGGLTGSGIGGSRTKLGYLPYAHSDFIFSIIADELGMIGTVAVVGGFIVLVAFGIQAALAAPDRFGMLLAGGISTWFGVQAIVNLGGVTGVMPVTGLTLPFFSAGGTSLFASMVAAGLLLSVARRAVRN